MKINLLLLSLLLYSCKIIIPTDEFIYITKFVYNNECQLHLTSCAYSKIYNKDKEINFFESTLKNFTDKKIIRINNNGNLYLPINKKYINESHYIVIDNKYIKRTKINLKELMKQDTIFIDLKPNVNCNYLDCESSESNGVY